MRFEEVENKDLYSVVFSQIGGTPQTVDNDGVFFNPRVPIEIVEVRFIHDNDSTSATFNIENLPSGTSVGSGQTLFTTGFDTSTGMTVEQVKTREDFITSSVNGHPSNQLFPGEMLGSRRAGNRTNLRGVTMTVFYKILGKGDYR